MVDPTVDQAAGASGAPGAVSPAEALELDEEQRAAALEEIAALAASLSDAAARARWEELARAVSAGAGAGADGGGEAGPPALTGEQVSRLESVLALTLETGRARRVQGPEAEQALLRLYRKTPGGAAVERLTREANQALAALAGQRVSRLAFSPQAPGTFKLEISTDACQLVVEVGRRGITVDSVGVDL
jgi:hypothetical protein